MLPSYATLKINEQKFWKRVTATARCRVVWASFRDRDNYGSFQFGYLGTKYKKPAHVAAYELKNGPLPAGTVLRHTCDNRPCCSEEHLIPGTHNDNVQDKVRKNRQAKGSANGRAKLTERDIPKIRSLLRKNLSLRDIADRFGVTSRIVRLIRDGALWTHA